MTNKEAYEILGLADGADLSEIKRAYRTLAFTLHPDLNPDMADASKRFQLLNEAYVTLSQPITSGPYYRKAGRRDEEATAKARDEAHKAYSKAKAGQKKEDSARQSQKGPEDSHQEEVLNTILNDPFARRVFEDIYSHIRHQDPPPSSGPGQKTSRPSPAQSMKKPAPQGQGTMMGKVKGWLRKQIDDEQVLRLPRESLQPGRRIRLQIQHGFGGEPETIELTLPPEFKPGKAMRLKGMGRRLGSLRGDLYVRIEAN